MPLTIVGGLVYAIDVVMKRLMTIALALEIPITTGIQL